MLHRSLKHVTFLKWFASPVYFVSHSWKLKNTGLSNKYKNTYESSHTENKKCCQNPEILSTISMRGTK